jgi:hypothetical protein
MSETRTDSPFDPELIRDRLISEAASRFARSEPTIATELLRQLSGFPIDDTILQSTDPFFRPWIVGEKKVIASFEPGRRPTEGEIIVIYGNYPHMYENIVVNNPIKRHASTFWNLVHDRIEYDRRWDPIDQIYIINADKRIDRYDSILRELAAAKAPFDRITRVPASIPADRSLSRTVAGSIGCLQSHLDALHRARESGFSHILMLEDDFSFTSDLEAHLQDLQTFFQRGYPYWICLLATSKYGHIVPKDDLISLSYQKCTNAAAYLASRRGVLSLIPVYESALEDLSVTGDIIRYAADRCWSVLQPSEKFFVFKRKFGFQAAGFSDIEGSITRYLD